MFRRITSFLLLIAVISSLFTNVAFAALEDEDEIINKIESVQTVYEPSKTYFVSNSTQKWVGEDNVDGDKTLSCFYPGTTNSHGRFGGLWQSMGFANYVFYNVFGEMPQFGYHCNPGELNDKVDIIGRYSSECRYLRGSKDGIVNTENINTLMKKAKIGDILVVAPHKRCNAIGKAMIIVELNEASATVYHADFKGDCAVTKDIITYNALAGYHCVSLLRSANYPYPEPVPPIAVENVNISIQDVSLNESVEISWMPVKHTDNYKVVLVDSDNKDVTIKESKKEISSFIFDKAGIYRVKVIACNEFGESEPTFSQEIKVHNQNIVTFKDYDGTVITTQKVEYGKDAVAPPVPQRKGYQFAGWDNDLRNIIHPITVTATYEIENYTIRYYDIGGKNVLSTETVAYQERANLPTNYTLDDGYLFAGWQISFDSIGKDYTCVDGDMSLIATQKWANLNLPITIDVSNVQRDANATFYSADLIVKNHDENSSKSFKILGTLKSADGKALKSVVLDEIILEANEDIELKDRRIVYSEKATVIEFVAVGIVGNSKTGGAYSKLVASNILDNSQWGSWSEWTTEDEISEYDDYESKIQYRNRSKVFTTANTSTLDGWTKYNTTSNVGGWSGWSSSYVSAFTNDSQKREVETRNIAATYETRYVYDRSVSNDGKYSSYNTSYHPRYQSIDLNYRLSAKGTISGRTRYGSYAGAYGTYLQNFWWNERTYQKQVSAAYTQYRYRDTYYTHHYWKWGDWTDWSDTYIANDDTEERTIYRYRNQNSIGDVENTEGKSFTIEGIIENVESDFSGLTSTIMVYKKCNTDPTEEQLEYVGETIIGDNNTFSFEFKPREIPSKETGDFIVALGIEGADRLVNIDVIEAELPTYTVKFIVDGNEYGEKDENSQMVIPQIVKEGGSAIAPVPPEKTGYTFVKWSETLTGITSDKVVSAEFVPNEYSLVFIDWETNQVSTLKQKYGETIHYPELQKVNGVKNRTWNKQQEGITNVSESMVIETVAELESYTVTFNDDSGIISTQEVKYGNKAIEPISNIKVEGMNFAGWVGSCSSEYITQDVAFTPVYVYEKTVATPEANLSDVNSDGECNVTLKCDTANSEIYYKITTHDAVADLTALIEPDEYEDNFRTNAIKYTGSFTLAENETVNFIAYADGMNDSIPSQETNENNIVFFDVNINDNDIRQYRNSIEGRLNVSLLNNKPEYSTGNFNLCFYDQRGVMIDFMPLNVDIKPGMNNISFEEIKIDEIDYTKSKTISCKLFIWLSGDSIMPISDFVEVNIK